MTFEMITVKLCICVYKICMCMYITGFSKHIAAINKVEIDLGFSKKF